MMIAGDGYAYSMYDTVDHTRTDTLSATQAYPLAAFSQFDLLQQYTGDSNFGAALSEYGTLAQTMGWNIDPNSDALYMALQNGDSTTALNLENNLRPPRFYPMYDSSDTAVRKLHILRVGSDGSSSDMIAQQWTGSWSTVYTFAPTPSYPYNFHGGAVWV